MNDLIRQEPENTPSTGDAPVARRPYVKPEIVELGDVRELTRGAGSGPFDGKGGKRTM
jgi:hypothetical protein